MVESSDAQSVVDLVAQVVALTTQVQENSNFFMALENKNATLRRENCTLQERLSTVKSTPQQPHDPRFLVPIKPIQPLFTSEPEGSSSQPLAHQSVVTNTSTAAPTSNPLIIGGTTSAPIGSTMSLN